MGDGKNSFNTSESIKNGENMDRFIEYLAEQTENRINEYKDFNEFVNKRFEFAEVFDSEFADVCYEEYYDCNEAERVYRMLKCFVFAKVVKNLNCNFVGVD